jgi:hypothetical protein
MLRGTCLVLILAASRVGAQADLSVGAGAGSIRYSGGESVGSFTLAPVGSLSTRWWATGAAAAFGPVDDGSGWAGQLRADAWVTSPRAHPWRPAVSVVLDGSAQTGGPATAAAHVLGESVWTHDSWGIAAGLGPSLGAISTSDPVSGLHLRARSWGRIGRAVGMATIEPQLLQDAWFTDLTMGVATPEGRVEVSGWIAMRVSQAYESRVAGSVSAQVTLSSRVALEASGGSYLPDLYQGFPASGFASIGLRAFLIIPPSPTAAPVPRAAQAVRENGAVVIRFTVPDARQVAIAGEWSDWQPIPLVAVGSHHWEARLALPPGTYRFTLLVDGARWLVPAGVAVVPDDMGGEQGVLVVP